MIEILPCIQCLHVVIMLIQLVLACSKALLPTKSNPASIKERAEVFPPSWCVEALKTSSFCYSASVGIGIIVLQTILLGLLFWSYLSTAPEVGMDLATPLHLPP